MLSVFRIGDTVRALPGTDSYGLSPGTQYIITGVDYIAVGYRATDISEGSKGWYLKSNWAELVIPYIVPISPKFEDIPIGMPVLLKSDEMAVRVSDTEFAFITENGEGTIYLMENCFIDESKSIVDWFDETTEAKEKTCPHGQAGWCRTCGSTCGGV
jgi:hypothetical protein